MTVTLRSRQPRTSQCPGIRTSARALPPDPSPVTRTAHRRNSRHRHGQAVPRISRLSCCAIRWRSCAARSVACGCRVFDRRRSVGGKRLSLTLGAGQTGHYPVRREAHMAVRREMASPHDRRSVGSANSSPTADRHNYGPPPARAMSARSVMLNVSGRHGESTTEYSKPLCVKSFLGGVVSAREVVPWRGAGGWS